MKQIMGILLFMINGVNIGTPEIMIIILALFVIFLILRNIMVQPEE